MIIIANNNKRVLLRRLEANDHERLHDYLLQLSPGTKNRFGPHGFDSKSISDFFENPDISAYIAQDINTMEIIAYSIIMAGYLQHDVSRLRSYGLIPDHRSDCTFAPSVADLWQDQGIGYGLFCFILTDLIANGRKRIILWGGVQSDNVRAVNFYFRNGFRILGQFEQNGLNLDMVSYIGEGINDVP